MNIFENPFYILGVSPADNRRAIAAAADDKAFLLGDSKAVEEARSALLIPDKRLAAEMRWFPGSDSEQVSEIIKFLGNLRDGKDTDIEDLDEITDAIDGIDKVNLFIYIWEFKTIDDYETAILEINDGFEEIYTEDVLDLINEARKEAGFPEADEPELEQELNNYRADIVKAIDGKLSAVELYDYINIINNLAEEYSGGGSLILGDLLDNYELNTAPSLEEQKILVLSELEALKPLMIA
ncbi:MAG: hypothetical protein IJM40_04240, partial [Synergistaceae bacterium]|nr:hypothetical protein [Synergistaceae bacterium]